MAFNRKWRNRISRERNRVDKKRKKGDIGYSKNRLIAYESGMTLKLWGIYCKKLDEVYSWESSFLKSNMELVDSTEFQVLFNMVYSSNMERLHTYQFLKTSLGWMVEDTLERLLEISDEHWTDIKAGFHNKGTGFVPKDDKDFCLILPHIFVKGYLVATKYCVPFYIGCLQYYASTFVSEKSKA